MFSLFTALRDANFLLADGPSPGIPEKSTRQILMGDYEIS
jgi:hypothetical protein